MDDLASSHLLCAMSDALMVTIALVIVVGGSIITHHRALTRRPGAVG
ncbi:hypothetical protein [Acidipropionibacterium jensenii]|nr:hypothetical protein [Acidipropionibacterium jensenii]